MKKKLLVLLSMSLLASAPTMVYADEKDDRIAELEAQVFELEAKNAELQEMIDKLSPKATDQESYGFDEPWVVDGQWKVTVKSVEEVAERNEYSDKDPAAVYLVTYEYENIGYEAEGWNGLFLSLEDGIVDASGKMGYSYPGDVAMFPQETPVGATCEAQACIGVDNAGSFKINYVGYDGNGNEQKAVFDITVE